MDLDAILGCFGRIREQVNLLVLSKSEIYFDFFAGITISIVGNYYQAAGN